MYLEIFLADFAVFRVFWGISRDFAEIPEFRGSATARNIRSPDFLNEMLKMYSLFLNQCFFVNRKTELFLLETVFFSLCAWRLAVAALPQTIRN